MELAQASNKYFDQKQPWKTRKNDMADCGVAINVCLQTVKALATLMAPFLPFSAAKCAEMLKLDGGLLPWQGATEELPAGLELGEAVLLFKKLDFAELFSDPTEAPS